MSRAKRLMVAVETWQLSASSSMPSAVTRMGLRSKWSAICFCEAEPVASTCISICPSADCANAASGADSDAAALAGGSGGFMTRRPIFVLLAVDRYAKNMHLNPLYAYQKENSTTICKRIFIDLLSENNAT